MNTLVGVPLSSTRIKCPHCKEPSTVVLRGQTSPSKTVVFWDKECRFHQHYIGEVVSSLECDNRHKFEIKEAESCWCGFKSWYPANEAWEKLNIQPGDINKLVEKIFDVIFSDKYLKDSGTELLVLYESVKDTLDQGALNRWMCCYYASRFSTSLSPSVVFNYTYSDGMVRKLIEEAIKGG